MTLCAAAAAAVKLILDMAFRDGVGAHGRGMASDSITKASSDGITY